MKQIINFPDYCITNSFGVAHQNISAACRGTIPSAYGFNWNYIEVDE